MTQPSAVAIMSTAKDEPMNLGPFLQEFVLNNPFTQTMNAAPAKPQVKPVRPPYKHHRSMMAVRARSLFNASPPKVHGPIRTISPSPVVTAVTTTSQIPVLAVKAIPSPIVQQVAPLVHQQPVPINTVPTINPMAIHLAASNAGRHLPVGSMITTMAALPGGGDLGVVDTPKAHIGSNRNFAAMLREAKLPLKHMKVKKWLLKNYRHRMSSPNWLLSDDLLDHANEVFADLKSNVLSRIMKVTFPHCHKVINKYGNFYIGLVRKPQKQHYEDKVLCMAAEAVSTGRMTADMACQVHCVSSELLDRMVVWIDTPADTTTADRLVLTETDSESDGNQTPPHSYPRRQLRKKPRSTLHPNLKDVTECDDSPDWTPDNQGASSYGSCKARKRRGNSLNSEEVQVKKERLDEDEETWASLSDVDDDTRMDNEDGSSEASLPIIAAIGSVRVKDEPLDLDYEPNDNNNNYSPCDDSPDDVRESFHSLQSMFSEESVSDGWVLVKDTKPSESLEPTDLSCKKPSSPDVDTVTTSGGGNVCNGATTTSARSQSLSSVVDLLTVKQELHRTRDHLDLKMSQNNELEIKLSKAHSEIGELQKTVSTQETQLCELASEFFELSNRFVKMTHTFKQVLKVVKASQIQRT